MKKHTLWALILMSTAAVACGDDDNAGSGGSGAAGGNGGSGGAVTSSGGGGSGGSEMLSNEDKAVALIGAFESGDPAVLDYVSDSYIQHNLAFPDGKEVLAGFFTGTPTGITVETHRVYSDGDIVFMHNAYGGGWNNGTPQVAFDVFRFEGGLIAEHWDNLQDVEDDMDGTTQTDGAVDVADLDQTEANRMLIESAAQNLFVDGQWSTIGDYFDLDNYIQHSVGFGPDATGLINVLGGLPDGTPFYTSVEYVYVEGNFALVMSQGLPDMDTGLSDAYFDLFRVANGKIIEHWDIIQTIPAMADWANSNGKW